MAEKEEFYTLLRKEVGRIDVREDMVLGGYLNCHVGAEADGFEGVHEGRGFGSRNAEGEMMLEFAQALDLIVANTWFTKSENKLVTYESDRYRTVIDYILVRRRDRLLVKDVKVIPVEECLSQHRLIVCVMKCKRRSIQTKEVL